MALILIILIFLAVLVTIGYACLVAAGREEQQMEKRSLPWDDKSDV